MILESAVDFSWKATESYNTMDGERISHPECFSHWVKGLAWNTSSSLMSLGLSCHRAYSSGEKTDPVGIIHLSTGLSVSNTLCQQYPKISESQRDSTTWDWSPDTWADLWIPSGFSMNGGEPITGCHLRLNPVLRYSISLGFQDMIPATLYPQSATNNQLSATCYLLLE